jgi:uncharacterized membrane protein YbhN (UPF0104 family)
VIEAFASSIALWQHAAAIGFVVLDIVARGARSTALIPVRLTQAMMVNCCGDALAAVTPSRAGGDPVRYVWFVRAGIPGPAVLSSFATENAVNTVVLVTGGVLLLVFFTSTMSLLVRQAVDNVTAPTGMRIAAAGCGVIVVAAFTVHRRYPHLSRRLVDFLRETWRLFLTQPRVAVSRATVWTVVSMIARTAILPVLLVTRPGIQISSLLIGSVLTLYALLLSPTPGGLGPIEAGFFAGLHGSMDARQISELLVIWRAYAWSSSAVLGAVLLLYRRVRRPVTPTG